MVGGVLRSLSWSVRFDVAVPVPGLVQLKSRLSDVCLDAPEWELVQPGW